MNKVINAGAAYFLSYLGMLILDFFVINNVSGLLKSLLSFISIIIKIPKNIFELLFEITELGNIFLLICFMCLIIKIIVFIRENIF